MKHKVFIDESGDHSLANINDDFPIFALLGLIASEESYEKLCDEINNFKIKYFNSTEVILHSRDIRKCEGPFAILFDLEMKKGFYNDLNNILKSHNFMLVASAILKQKHVDKYGKLADDPYEIALTFVLERILFESDARKNSKILDVVIESRGKREDQKLAERYNELLYKGSSQVSSKRFVATFCSEIDFKRKKENDIGLQIADLCAYPIARHVLYPKEPYPSFDVIKDKIRCGSKGIDGYGIKVFP